MQLWKRLIRNSSFAYSAAWQLFCLRHGAVARHSEEVWAELRNKHKGQRGFVIGNGPSLKLEDLDAIRGEVTLAANKCYMAFPKVQWRPTYVSCSDKLLWGKIGKDLVGQLQRIFILSTLDPSLASIDVVVFRHLGSFEARGNGFSFDSGKGQFGGYTVTYNNLQMAVHLGLNPIYLIGCDHYYKGEPPAGQYKEKVAHEGQQNHFIPNYREKGEVVKAAPIELMTAGFENAHRLCAAQGIQVFNATRGGYLEAFPRVDFDSLVSPGRSVEKQPE